VPTHPLSNARLSSVEPRLKHNAVLPISDYIRQPLATWLTYKLIRKNRAIKLTAELVAEILSRVLVGAS
jgi:hypothetical protein